jgi:hypothetical protein
MNTKLEIIAKLKAEYPTLKTGSEEVGYIQLEAKEYEATIAKWAEVELEMQAKEAAAVKAETDKEALLARIGITADEAKLLLS